MPLILYTQLVIGNLFVIRTLQLFRARALLSTSLVTKTGTAFVSASTLIAFFCANDAFLCFGLWLICIFLAVAWLFLCERRQIDTLKGEIPVFLDRWILNLRLGSALPTAREAALNDHSTCFQTLLRPLFATQNPSQRKRSHLLLSGPLLVELERLQQEPHLALARLENLRQLLRKASEFRRKSGQALQQTYIQCAVMMILLFALIVFTIHRYGWHHIADLILLAVGLSSLGTVTMYCLARKTKWKI